MDYPGWQARHRGAPAESPGPAPQVQWLAHTSRGEQIGFGASSVAALAREGKHAQKGAPAQLGSYANRHGGSPSHHCLQADRPEHALAHRRWAPA
ncbi:hypothetical protein VTN96DRAFT_3235 [Rasamsonia emersonii]